MKLSLLKPLFIGIILLCLWQLIGVFGDFPHYIFPSPQAVWLQLTSHSELLWQHTLITLIEIGLGLLLGFLFGLSSALLLSFSPKTSSLLLPVLVISQAIPVFAIAPILVLWLGYGMPSKILMAILIIYLPVTMDYAIHLKLGSILPKHSILPLCVYYSKCDYLLHCLHLHQAFVLPFQSPQLAL